MLRTRTPSVFRPHKAIDQHMLTENRALVDDINRRNILRGALSLGALTLLTGCDVSEEDSVQKALRAVSSWNDAVQAAIFRPNHLAPTFSPSQVVKPPRFNAYYDIEDVKPIEGAIWKLELAGLIKDKRPWTAEQIYQLPEQELIIRHICVEGWDYIGQWSGPNLRGFSHADRRRSDREIRLLYLQRRFHRKHRHGVCTASADDSGHQIRRGAHCRSVRLSAAAAHCHQARLQEREMDQGNRSHQHVSRDFLEQAGRKLVRRDLSLPKASHSFGRIAHVGDPPMPKLIRDHRRAMSRCTRVTPHRPSCRTSRLRIDRDVACAADIRTA